ncbi:hypothetical protein HanXRQr2_Chr06g0277321 [Helianthus annuus]|uniref:Uncharacterized protein n=1 Tax=Helianthus annuus TaxID=4232 RepID=A0A9K3IW51_HELAN|nr:hypothetical protein HanXRQr2_Chr06g0277321 [Helianthus annuus]KAJ0916982.1 hypothetical protein HanPSC8_Chr06g0268121 [Helianthus annuus]
MSQLKDVLHTEYFDIEIPTDATETIEMVNATEDNFTEDYEKLQELLVDALMLRSPFIKDVLTSQSCPH